MPAVELPRLFAPKPWGRRDVPARFGWTGGAEPLGEIIFESRPADALLVKYLFTSQRLSIQVHPDERRGRALGHRSGKDEYWLVLEAEPEATIALGPKHALTEGTLRAAAQDGTLADILDWRPVRAGDSIYSPAGTIHAIGPGLVLLEIQQNLDLTWRLFDYGRPRALHLEEALGAATLEPWRETPEKARAFSVERWTKPGRIDGDAWAVPLQGKTRIDGRQALPGSTWRIEAGGEIEVEGEVAVARTNAP